MGWYKLFCSKRLKEILNTFEIGGNSQINTIELSPSVTLKLSPKGTIENQIFHLGSMLDFDSGGFVISNIIENMSFCIEEKANKIKSCQSKYKYWWLILIDEISYGLSQEDKQYVASKMEKPPIWEKVITLNTLNGEKILEI